MDRFDIDRFGRDADHRSARIDVAGDDGVGADLGPDADRDRPQYLRARSDDDAVAQGRVTLAPDPG